MARRALIWVELVTATFAITYGAWLLVPSWTSYNVVVYRTLTQYAPEDVWGLTALLCGLFHAIAIMGKWLLLRRIAMAGELLFWAIIASQFALYNTPSTGTPVYTTLFALIMVQTIFVQHGPWDT